MDAEFLQGRIKGIEERQNAFDSRLDRLMLLLIGTLGTSVATLLAVLMQKH